MEDNWNLKNKVIWNQYDYEDKSYYLKPEIEKYEWETKPEHESDILYYKSDIEILRQKIIDDIEEECGLNLYEECGSMEDRFIRRINERFGVEE